MCVLLQASASQAAASARVPALQRARYGRHIDDNVVIFMNEFPSASGITLEQAVILLKFGHKWAQQVRTSIFQQRVGPVFHFFRDGRGHGQLEL